VKYKMLRKFPALPLDLEEKTAAASHLGLAADPSGGPDATEITLIIPYQFI